ncbi:MAG TPA: hydantoinase B/oxoprolinase family protein [Planctomycetaceae bacterium]|nr:hydantoinase B/oxoprolinase family protein [Planctomycetaceae bacterium]
MASWQFWIDVGGTFTDCIAVAPDGPRRVIKVLSSGVTKGAALPSPERERGRLSIPTTLANRPADFYRGYQLTWLDDGTTAVVAASSTDGELTLVVDTTAAARPGSDGGRFELSGGEEAPIVAIREALGLRLDQPIPPVDVRLGTTRGTNALLTRRGAKTGFVTTKGFADVLLIANQDRPKLFDLAIQKPPAVCHAVAEIDERLAADGTVLKSPDCESTITALQTLKAKGCESLAVCLLHAFVNPTHEEFIANLAAEVGFRYVSVSSRLSPLIKIVSRGDTTVMDAYLNPILQEYVARLQAKLPGSDLRFMTSSGGLVRAERFTGKECVLSGPAGGVIGFSRCGQEAGFGHTIGFDMGGTSTDVSRFDGRFEYEFETKKAGVRIVTPMLAIETVAAGGGSICGFDGVKLFVGPDSAGADPGPACYGRGGPLTVTDCNVYLGRIPPACFPFPMDLPAIEVRLRTLCAAVQASPLGQNYTPHQLAAGFLEIANAAMARAIRSVSTAKGYDPADYALVPFGGAGGQHACALIRLLGMQQILAHPLAGVLSAYGIGHADVRRFRQQSVLMPYSDEAVRDLQSVIADLTEAARDEVLAEGMNAVAVAAPVVSLDLRYKGVEATISVPRPPDGDYPQEYAAQHCRLYGYERPDRPLEIVAVRVEVIGQGAALLPPLPTPSDQGSPPVAHASHQMWLDGAWTPCPVMSRSALQPGHVLSGPAIVAESTSTLVIDPGYTARVLPRGEIVIEIAGIPGVASPGRASRDGDLSSADPVQLELFHQTFGSFAEQMGLTLQHTSVSTNVKERLDFSCAIFDPTGGLVVNAPHIPVHLGAMSETVRCILRDNPDLAPGDVFVTNDPYRGGSHLPDVTVVTPVHHPNSGELLFLTASRAHHAEIGGIVPGSMPPFSKNLGDEGVLIRNLKLVAGGQSHEDELAALLASGKFPSRNVADNLADVRAQVAANRLGAQLLLDLVQRRGAHVVRAYMGHLQQASSAAMRRALERLPDGEYRFTDHLDDGAAITVTIRITGDRAVLDFTGTAPVLSTNLNANRAITTAAVMYALRCLIGVGAKSALDSQLPLNSGVLEPIELVIPESLLNPPEHPDPAQCPAMVGGNVETSQRVVDVLLGALGIAAASQGTMNNLTFGDGTFGYYETICGGSGATPGQDGADAVHTHMTNTRLTDPEVIERRYPVRLHEFRIRRGSGGQGQHRGGDGIVRRIEFLRPLKVSLLTERRGPYAPYGLDSGNPGALGRNTLTKATGETINLGGKASFDVAAGDVLTLESPGGGGYGKAG